MPSSICLLTWDGLVVHHEAGDLHAREIAEPLGDTALRLAAPELAKCGDAFIYNMPKSVAFSIALSPGRHLRVTAEAGFQGLHLHDGGGFLCKEANHRRLSFNREQASGWETFLPLSEVALHRLRHLLDNRWVSRFSSPGTLSATAMFVSPFVLRIGHLLFDLRQQDIDLWNDFDVWITHGGWRLEQLFLYRPLVYITAYSSSVVLQQLQLCVKSLRRFGQYFGPIAVMTDQSESQIKALFAAADVDPGQIRVVPLPAQDFIGFVCSKYSLEHPTFAGHQPLLYLDPDIVADRPIEQMLADATRADKLCAPFEEWNQLHNHIPVGASLLQLDGIEARFAPGLNGGTLTIPNTTHQIAMETIRLIRHTIGCVGLTYGREYNRWADQEVMNYVAVKTGAFNGVVLTPYVAHHAPVFPHGGRRTGLVHFWGRTSTHKVDAMTAYIATLVEAELAADGAMGEMDPDFPAGAAQKSFPILREQRLPERLADDLE